MNPARIWTIGYSEISAGKLVEILKNHGIETLVDVRRWPRSKREEFNRERLEERLRSSGVEYVWMGDKLGGYRKGGYERYMETREFRQAVQTLVRLASEKKICILCLEAHPNHCHRRFIAETLSSIGVEVTHIIAKRRGIHQIEHGSLERSILRVDLSKEEEYSV